MELLLAAVIGAVAGWLAGRGRSGRDGTDAGDRRTPRPTRRQQKILATLPPDPTPPSIEELMREEAAATGVDRLADAELPLAVRLKVWHRDHPEMTGCPPTDLRFVILADVAPGEATVEDVRLECGGNGR